MKHKSEQLLSVLLAGIPVAIGDWVYMLSETDREDGHLSLFIAHAKEGEKGALRHDERTFFEHELTLRGFIKLAVSISQDNLFLIGAAKVLTKFNRKDRSPTPIEDTS